MSEKVNTYEAMFLVDSGQASFEAASEPIRSILTRRSAEILALKPWDDRKLAYEIRGRKRGLYILSYFRVDPLQVMEIEHDCRLEERVLRALILRRDQLKPEEIAAETPATSAGHRPPETAAAPGAAPADGAAPSEAAAAARTPAIPDAADETPQAGAEAES